MKQLLPPFFALMIVFLVPVAGADTISYVPSSGGLWSSAGNWDLGRLPQQDDAVQILASNPLTNQIVTYDSSGEGELFESITIGTDSLVASRYGMLHQSDYLLTTHDMDVGYDGTGYHWMENGAFLAVTGDLNIGVEGTGHFILSTSETGSGARVDGSLNIGSTSEGYFDHQSGDMEVQWLSIGRWDTGTYTLSDGHLDVTGAFTIGRSGDGLFEQFEGTVDVTCFELVVGQSLSMIDDQDATYRLHGGVLNARHLFVGKGLNATFEQSGGTLTTTSRLFLGAQGEDFVYQSGPVAFRIDSTDGPSVLNVGTSLLIGLYMDSIYEQNGATVTVGEDLIVHGDLSSNSEVVNSAILGPDAGTLEVGESITNKSLFHQQGGTVTTPLLQNGVSGNAYDCMLLLEDSAIMEARTFESFSGEVRLSGGALLRGPLAIPPSTYWNCSFTNDGIFTMGTEEGGGTWGPGGTFQGSLVNNGSFVYHGGDFLAELTNNGDIRLDGPLTCRIRIENNSSMTITEETPVTIEDGASMAFLNNGTLEIENRGVLDLDGGRLVNGGSLFAGGTDINSYTRIQGDVANRGILLPSVGRLAKGILRVEGDYSNTSTGELQIRLQGTIPGTGHDQLWATGSATLGGSLSVDTFPGYVPQVNDYYVILAGSPLTGEFDHVELPTLPAGRYWRVEYESTIVALVVKDHPVLPGDCDDDGDIDLDDFAGFGDCLQGPGVPVGSECDCYLLDGDSDVDLADYMIFQQLFTGAE